MDISQAGAAVTAVGAMTYGSHCCLVSDDDALTELAISAYVRDGLAAHDRVLCVLGLRDRSWLLESLAAARIPLDLHVSSGALVIVEMRQGPMWAGEFSPTQSASIMFGAIDAALADGYEGLRVLSDMSWGLLHGVESAALVEMERLIGEGLEERLGMGLCFYDPGQFTEAHVEACAQNHGTVTGNAIAQEPNLQILETARGLRLIGEADLTDRDRLDEALEHAAARSTPGAEVVVDMSSLVFADVTVMQALFLAASRLDQRRCLVLRSPTPTVGKVLTFLGADTTRGLRVDRDGTPGGAT